MKSAGRPGLGSSSKVFRSRLNSDDHFATVKYFGLLSPYILISLGSMDSFGVRTLLSEELYDCSDLNILTFHFWLYRGIGI